MGTLENRSYKISRVGLESGISMCSRTVFSDEYVCIVITFTSHEQSSDCIQTRTLNSSQTVVTTQQL